MRILITSFEFAPSIGGIETAGETLARGLAARGHDVTVVTAQENSSADDFPFKVVRQPGRGELLRLVRQADAVWQNHISLRFLWPLALIRKPLVIMHHLVLETDVGSGPRHGMLKRLACRLGDNAFASEALRVKADLPGPVIYNTYDAAIFRELPDVPRDRDVVFLGRLQTYKGPDILIDALAQLAQRGRRLTATIIGGGPESEPLQAQAQRLGIADRFDFTGPLRGDALARALNRHRIIAIPPRGEEAFSITALEGLACGCVAIGTQSGGLPEAIGPCGLVVPQNDPAALAQALTRLLDDPALHGNFRTATPVHLARFSNTALIDACEAMITKAAGR
jgi:glycosyltransferase involved in cell wall biosynthesis